MIHGSRNGLVIGLLSGGPGITGALLLALSLVAVARGAPHGYIPFFVGYSLSGIKKTLFYIISL